MAAFVNQYRQIIRTYLRRPGFARLVIPTLLAWSIWLAWKTYSMHGKHWWMQAKYYTLTDFLSMVDPLFFFLPFVGVLSYVVIWMAHVREQLATPRSYLVPDYRMRHLVVAAGAFLAAPIAGVAVTVVTEQCLGLARESYPLELFAIALTILIPAAWIASLRSPWAALITLPLIPILAIWTPIGPYLHDLASGGFRQHEMGAYVPLMSIQLILLDIAVLALLFYRLMLMKPDVRPWTPDAIPEPANRIVPAPLIRHKPILSAMQRIWHRRRGVLDPAAPWAVASLLIVLLVGFGLIHGTSRNELLRALLLPTCIPGAIVSIVWRERLMNLPFESLYPARHLTFINELLGAAALSLVEMWVSIMLAAIAPILIWHSDLHGWMPVVVAAVIASALMQVLVFGVLLVASVHLRGMSILFANVLTIIAVVIPMEGAIEPVPSLSPTRLIVFGLIEAAIGLLLTWYGTSAWRRADLA